ncbi:hypothetical protein [Mycobacterium intracellulare]|nr:hypothetical protein [Mycobacterium intracellulare]
MIELVLMALGTAGISALLIRHIRDTRIHAAVMTLIVIAAAALMLLLS